MIEIIAAMDMNRGIGFNNTLPWNLPRDMKHFVTTTKGKTVLMGRKTFESIGKPLPNRTNLVLSNQDLDIPGVLVLNKTGIAAYRITQSLMGDTNSLMVIGGSNVYEQFLPLASKLYITRVHGTFECDSYFPEFEDKFKLIESVDYEADEKNAYNMSIQTYVRG